MIKIDEVHAAINRLNPTAEVVVTVRVGDKDLKETSIRWIKGSKIKIKDIKAEMKRSKAEPEPLTFDDLKDVLIAKGLMRASDFPN